MNKRIAILVLVIAALGALAVAPLVFGGPHGGRRFAGHGFGHGFGRGHDFGAGFALGRIAHLKDELELTDQQTAELRTIFTELQTQNAAHREQMRGGIHDIAKTLIANPNDLAGAQAQLDAQAAAERALKTNILQATSKALNVLNADQRTKLGSLLEKHAERMQNRRTR